MVVRNICEFIFNNVILGVSLPVFESYTDGSDSKFICILVDELSCKKSNNSYFNVFN